MLTVCHLISGDLWGGAEVMGFHLLKELNKNDKLKIFVILLNSGRLSRELMAKEIDVHIVDESEYSFFAIYFKIKKILKKCPPDIIHSHRYKENILAFMLAGLTPGVKLVSTQHGGLPEVWNNKSRSGHNLVSLINFSLVLRFFSLCVGVSNDIRESFLSRIGFQVSRVCAIHNGIEISENKYPRKHTKQITVGSAGRFFPVKEYSFLIEVAKSVKKRSYNVRFQLAGDGPEKDKLHALVNKYELNDVFEFLGYVEDMETFYTGLNIYVNTSVHEGIPMSILEAMSHGLPVIAPDVGGIGEIITSGKDGYLIAERDPEKFAQKIVQLCEKEEMYLRMSEKAREKVLNEFSVPKMSNCYCNKYFGLFH